MTYRIQQDFEYIGNDYWHWNAWIEANSEELDSVVKVIWLLHPSFKRSRIISTVRETGFRLETAGWGTFRLRAEVVTRNGNTVNLAHNLQLEYPETDAYSKDANIIKNKNQKVENPTKIFLSYSGEDSRDAAKLRTKLQEAGMEVLDASQVGAGQSLTESIRQMLARSDAVIGLVGESDPSPWVIDEMKVAEAADKPSVILAPMGRSNFTGVDLPRGIQRYEIDLRSFEQSAISEIISKLEQS